VSLHIKLLIGSIAILVAVGFHWYDKTQAVERAIEANTASLNALYQKERDRVGEEARKATKELSEANAKALEDRDEYIKDINTKLSAITGSLHYYRYCATTLGDSRPPGSTKACPGRELSREDAEFLVREAARADVVVSERDYYYGRYEDARTKLEALKRPAP